MWVSLAFLMLHVHTGASGVKKRATDLWNWSYSGLWAIIIGLGNQTLALHKNTIFHH